MPVYVDDARIPFRGRSWSHMVADTAEELHRAAEALGLSRERVQDRGRTLHYDLPEDWRRRAIELGVAEPISRPELVRRRPGLAAGRKATPTNR
ncbi:MAG: DUF4031 domain-containing protein, partial [Pseudonocardiaceae bacterium]